MIPIVCVVGASNSGKTTFLEKLIPDLRGRGYRVGAVKHDAHSFEIDHEGKDTWRLSRAGAGTVVIASPQKVAAVRETSEEMDLDAVVGRFFWNEDIVITEGFKRSRFPKVEVFRTAVESKPICGAQDNLLCLVTDDPLDVEVPRFRFSEVSTVADLIEGRFLKGRKARDVTVRLDSKQLPMKDFVGDFVAGGIVGMLSTLRGWKSPRSIDIQIRLGDE